MKKHCPTCTCANTPLERLVERVGQYQAGQLLDCHQSAISKALSGGWTRKRLLLELLAVNLETKEES